MSTAQTVGIIALCALCFFVGLLLGWAAARNDIRERVDARIDATIQVGSVVATTSADRTVPWEPVLDALLCLKRDVHGDSSGDGDAEPYWKEGER